MDPLQHQADAVVAPSSPDERERHPGSYSQLNPALAPRVAALTRATSLPRHRASVERLDLDDGGAVVVAGPERHRRRGVVDVHAADVGDVREQVFDERAGLGVEAGYP